MMSFKKYIAEFIGTYGLVFCGTGAIIIDGISGGMITHTGVAITFGLIVMAMIYTFGEISGAHINPAVTIAFWLSGRFTGKHVIPYIISQSAGAIAASFTLLFLFPEATGLGATTPSGTVQQSFIMEVILSFFLMFVIMNVSRGSKEIGTIAGMAIGATVLLAALFAGPVSGASMNPARSLAPAIVSGQLQHLWIYIIAPAVGTSLAIAGCRSVRQKDCCRWPGDVCNNSAEN
jgi:aquaporin Z